MPFMKSGSDDGGVAERGAPIVLATVRPLEGVSARAA